MSHTANTVRRKKPKNPPTSIAKEIRSLNNTIIKIINNEKEHESVAGAVIALPPPATDPKVIALPPPVEVNGPKIKAGQLLNQDPPREVPKKVKPLNPSH